MHSLVSFVINSFLLGVGLAIIQAMEAWGLGYQQMVREAE